MNFCIESVNSKQNQVPIKSTIKALPVMFMMFLLALPCPAVAARDEAMMKTSPLKDVRDIYFFYEVYLGGLHAMDTAATFKRQGTRYSFAVKVGTKGFFRALAPWDADLISNGRIAKDKINPVSANVVTTWKEQVNSVAFKYNKKKSVEAVFVPPESRDNHEAIPNEMLSQAYDPLNGIIQVMTNIAYGQGCTQNVPIYDGHRRFDFVLRDQGYAELKGEDYSVFTGQAQKCEADLTMQAGTRKDREGSKFWDDSQGKGGRPPVYIYLGKVRDDWPNLPVRAETSTFFGNIMVHLKAVSDQPITSVE